MKTEEIRVTINEHDLVRHPVALVGEYIRERLQEAGVPVADGQPLRVTAGRLEWWQMDRSRQLMYLWTPDACQGTPGGATRAEL